MRVMLGAVPGRMSRKIVVGMLPGLLLLSPMTGVRAETLEQTYAKLCAGDVKNETCDALRKAMIEKLTGQSGGQQQRPAAQAAAPAQPAGPSPELVARWGEIGHWARMGTFVMVSTSDMTTDGTRTTSSTTMSLTYRWIDETTIAENHVQLEFVLDGAAMPAQMLTEIEVVNKLDPARNVITRTTNMRSPALGALPSTTMEFPVTPLKPTDYTETVVNGETWYTETTVTGDTKVTRSGKVTAAGRTQITETTQRPASANTLAQLRAVASQRQAQAAQALAQAEEEDDDLLGALLGVGLGLAVGEAAGLGSDEMLGAMVEGLQTGDPTAGMAGALLNGQGLGADALAGQMLGGQLGGQLGGGEADALVGAAALLGAAMNESAGGTVAAPSLGAPLTQAMAGGGAVGAGSVATKPNLAAGTCTGFTEQNYRTMALEGGNDVQLKTMCGQAFEYYVAYKRALAQGYSAADADRTYFAHEQSAKVAAGFLQSHGTR